MTPAPFDYAAPTSLKEALRLLDNRSADPKILAGGHSLLPLMKLRLAAPGVLVDLRRVPDLRGIQAGDGRLVIGAMTRYVDLEGSPLLHEHAPILAQAAGLVGDAQVRNRGTIGGAIAHADPAGDMPAVICCLDASLHLASPRGERTVPATEFFRDIFETALSEDEILTHISLPIPSTPPAQHYVKFRRRMCDWAIVGASVSVTCDDERITACRVFLTNVGPIPTRATAVESALEGRNPTAETISQAARGAGADLSPSSELNGSADYKRHLAGVTCSRALQDALGIGRA